MKPTNTQYICTYSAPISFRETSLHPKIKCWTSYRNHPNSRLPPHPFHLAHQVSQVSRINKNGVPALTAVRLNSNIEISL